MNRSPYPSRSMHGSDVAFLASVVGAGSSAPTIPATTVLPATDNFASSATRTSEGLYVITLKEKFPRILDVIPTIVAASGAHKHPRVTAWSETAGTITVTVFLADGSGVDDLESTDRLLLWVHAREDTY